MKAVLFILIPLILLAGCRTDIEQRPVSHPQQQSPEKESGYVVEPLNLENDIEEAIYGFDWKNMTQAEHVEPIVNYNSYDIRFADINFDGILEILIQASGDYMKSDTAVAVFQVNGKQLEPLATFTPSSFRVCGPDSWRENGKRYLQKEDGERVFLEYLYRDGGTYSPIHYLCEVSLEDFSITPISFCLNGPDGPDMWLRYDGEPAPYSPGLETINFWDDSIREENNLVQMTENEYRQLHEEYLEGLAEAGEIKVSDEFSYIVSLGEEHYSDFETYGLDITLPDGITEQQKDEIINRGIAKKVYEEYCRFAYELENTADEPKQKVPVWQPPEYDDPLQAMFCSFQWTDSQQRPLLSDLSHYSFDIWVGDINLDGTNEILISRNAQAALGREFYGGCEVYEIQQNSLTYSGGFLFDYRTQLAECLQSYYMNPQGEPVLRIPINQVSDFDPDLGAKLGNHLFEYTTEISLKDFEPRLISIVPWTSEDVLLPVSPDANDLIQNFLDNDVIDIFYHPATYGLKWISMQEHTKMKEQYQDACSDPLPLNISLVTSCPGIEIDYYGDYAGYLEDGQSFPVKASIEEFEAFLNNRIGQKVYEAWMAHQEP